MKRIWLTAIAVVVHISFLHAEESKFKFTFGSNLGNFPLEINNSVNNKISPGIKINSWSFSPNFSNFIAEKKLSNFSENKISKNNIYIKFNLIF